jgi:hypothetical protein
MGFSWLRCGDIYHVSELSFASLGGGVQSAAAGQLMRAMIVKTILFIVNVPQ